MGGINRSELYSDLDCYLSRRRELEPTPVKPKPKKSLFKGFFSRSSSDTEPIRQSEPVFEFGDHEPVIERTSIFQRLSKPFSRKEPVVEMEDFPESPVIDAKDDLKELARVFLKTLERLPDKDLQNFKSTAEFFQFKAILSKHSLIKSQDTEKQSEKIL